MSRALRAIADAVRIVGRAPHVMLSIYFILLFAVLPGSMLLGRQLGAAFEDRELDVVYPAGVDETWFDRVTPAVSVAGRTFAPAMLGFAAVLTNIDDLIELRPGTPAVMFTTLAWLGVWILLVGGIQRAAAVDHALSIGRVLREGRRVFVRLTIVGVASLLAVALVALVYSHAPPVAKSFGFLAVLAIVAVVVLLASYVRVMIVVGDTQVAAAFASAAKFVTDHPGPVLVHAASFALLWMAVLVVFALADATLDQTVTVRHMVIGQGYVLMRLLNRMLWDVSLVKLVGRPGA